MRRLSLIALLLPVLLVPALTATAQDRELKGVNGIAMHGEPKYPAGFDHFDYVNPNAPKGGELRLHATNASGASGTFDTFNAFTLKGVPAAGISVITETLTEQAEDEPFTLYGLVAQSMDMPEDRSSITFTLRPEAKWQDGKPITADDVVFSFNTLKTKGRPLYRVYYAGVKTVEALAPNKVKFSFAEGDNRELPLIVGQLPLLPKHYWEGRDFEKTTLEPPVGSGPYKVKSFEPGRFIIYERDKNYWGAKLPTIKGRYNADTIRYDYYRDDTVALEAFKSGEYDFTLEQNSKNWATAYDTPAVKDGQIKKEEIKHELTEGMQGYVFNLRRPLFQDRRVRQALGYLFDFEWSNKNLFYGQYKRSESYFSNSELAASGLPQGEELEILNKYRGKIPDEVFTKEYKAPVTDGTGDIRNNLRAALDLMKQAGWSIKNREMVNEKTGQPFRFEILLASAAYERITLPFKENLARIGINASVRTVDTAQYQNRQDNYDYDMIIDKFGQSNSPGNEQRDYWSSASAGEPGSQNTIGVKDPVIDELIELVISAKSRESLVARTHALDRVLLWGFYVIPQYYVGTFRIAYWDKFSRPEVTPKYGFCQECWWIDADKAAALKAKTGK
jgi:microcin C transport system substrate-binding protein